MCPELVINIIASNKCDILVLTTSGHKLVSTKMESKRGHISNYLED